MQLDELYIFFLPKDKCTHDYSLYNHLPLPDLHPLTPFLPSPSVISQSICPSREGAQALPVSSGVLKHSHGPFE